MEQCIVSDLWSGVLQIVQKINGIFQENRSNWYRSMKFGTDTLQGSFFWEKAIGHPKIQHGDHFFSRWLLFLSNAHYGNCSNSGVGIAFGENTLFRMFFWKTVLVPQKFKMATIFQDGRHFS